MLSSESAASGTNLTKAKNVILLDPVYGTYEYRRNTEWQAIGRAYRMGQNDEVNVIRFIIKNTVEDTIYNMNKDEDKSAPTEILKFETNEEDISLDENAVKDIIKAADDFIPKKKSKKKKEKVDLENLND